MSLQRQGLIISIPLRLATSWIRRSNAAATSPIKIRLTLPLKEESLQRSFSLSKAAPYYFLFCLDYITDNISTPPTGSTDTGQARQISEGILYRKPARKHVPFRRLGVGQHLNFSLFQRLSRTYQPDF